MMIARHVLGRALTHRTASSSRTRNFLRRAFRALNDKIRQLSPAEWRSSRQAWRPSAPRLWSGYVRTITLFNDFSHANDPHRRAPDFRPFEADGG